MLQNALKICLLIAFASSANATTLLFQLIISGTGGPAGGSFDAPILRITNQSTGGPATLTKLRLTVGDTAFNWDRTYVNAAVGTSTRTKVSPNDANLNGGVRSDVLEWNFAGLDAGERVDLGGELDPDSTDGTVNFRTILFNNGGDLSNNALLTIHFLDAGITRIQSLRLADQANTTASSYTFSTPIPEPGTLATFAAGIAAVLISRFRRRA